MAGALTVCLVRRAEFESAEEGAIDLRALWLLMFAAMTLGGCGRESSDTEPIRIPTTECQPVPAVTPAIESQPSAAQSNTKRALASMRRGKRLYNDGQYAEARAEFVAAKQLGLHSASTWIAACDERRTPRRVATATRQNPPAPAYEFRSTGDVDRDLDLIDHDLEIIERDLDYIHYRLHGPPPSVRIIE